MCTGRIVNILGDHQIIHIKSLNKQLRSDLRFADSTDTI